jgi:hypothetical protein
MHGTICIAHDIAMVAKAKRECIVSLGGFAGMSLEHGPLTVRMDFLHKYGMWVALSSSGTRCM